MVQDFIVIHLKKTDSNSEFFMEFSYKSIMERLSWFYMTSRKNPRSILLVLSQENSSFRIKYKGSYNNREWHTDREVRVIRRILCDLIDSSSRKGDMSIHFKKGKAYHDTINAKFGILSDAIWGMVSFFYGLVYFFLFRSTEFSLLFKGGNILSHIWEVFFQYTDWVLDTFCLTSSNEHIGSLARFSENISWDCKNIASMFEGKICGYEGSAFLPSFWDDDSVWKCGNNFISDGEIKWFWLCSNREYWNNSSSSC